MDENLRRWRLVLGQDPAQQNHSTQNETRIRSHSNAYQPTTPTSGDTRLNTRDQTLDRLIDDLYDAERAADLSRSAPYLATWLRDIRTYFPTPLVKVMQHDAIQRLGLNHLLLEPETVSNLQVDVDLISTILLMKQNLRPAHLETARALIKDLANQIAKRLRGPLLRALSGQLNRHHTKSNPRQSEIDSRRTIYANLN